MKTWIKALLVISTIAVVLVIIYHYVKRIKIEDLPTCHNMGSIHFIELTLTAPGSPLPYHLVYWDHIARTMGIEQLPEGTHPELKPPLVRINELYKAKRINKIQVGCGTQQYYDLGGK